MKIIEINPDIKVAVDANDGYCPCMIDKTPDAKCPCKDFRDMEEGECFCGRYEKIKDGE